MKIKFSALLLAMSLLTVSSLSFAEFTVNQTESVKKSQPIDPLNQEAAQGEGEVVMEEPQDLESPAPAETEVPTEEEDAVTEEPQPADESSPSIPEGNGETEGVEVVPVAEETLAVDPTVPVNPEETDVVEVEKVQPAVEEPVVTPPSLPLEPQGPDVNGDGVVDILDWIAAAQKTDSQQMLNQIADEIVQ